MPTITEAQLAANRGNAQLSPGPVTEAGKKRSSLNALRHGLTSRVVVLPNEDLNQYLAFSKKMIESLNAETDLERQLAQNIADQQWRLNRIVSVEEGMIALGHYGAAGNCAADHPEIHAALTAGAYRADSQSFVNISVYEQRINRVMQVNLAKLKAMQAERKAEEKARRDEAVMLYKFHKMQALSYDPQADGFVYSSAEIERESARRDRLEEAENARSVGYNLAAFRARMEKKHEKLAA